MPSGFTLAGGGCDVKTPPSLGQSGVIWGWIQKIKGFFTKPTPTVPEPRIFITGSYPFKDANGHQMWVCESQTEATVPAGVITAYAVGIADTETGADIPLMITSAASTASSQPSATAPLAPNGFLITGCGARVELGPVGTLFEHQLLTAIFPTTASSAPNGPATGCQAGASDYGASASGKVDAYAVNLLLNRAVIKGTVPTHALPGANITLQGGHFPLNTPMTVQVSNIFCGPPDCTQISQTLPTSNPRQATVTVPNGLVSSGDWEISILQAGWPYDVSGAVPFAVY